MKRIIIESLLSQNRVAIIEGQKLVDLFIEDKTKIQLMNNIYIGRVVNVIDTMNAAFIDIGLKENAYLHINDLPNSQGKKISEIIRQGQSIVVQVKKLGDHQKGAKVSCKLSISGRYLVLLNEATLKISNKIKSKKEKQRLLAALKSIDEKDLGFIVRTNAEGVSEIQIINEMKYLINLYKSIEQFFTHYRPPKCIYDGLNYYNSKLKDHLDDSIDEIITRSPIVHNHVQSYLEAIDFPKEQLKKIETKLSLFDYYNINQQIQDLLNKKVYLKNGASITIEKTEAMWVIDVNSDKYTGHRQKQQDFFYEVNNYSTQEIARQIKLRNMNGIILIDYINMKNPKMRNKVVSNLRKELNKDNTKCQVYPMTSLGLVQIARHKKENDIEFLLLDDCKACFEGKSYSKTYLLFKLEEECIRIMHHRKVEAVLYDTNINISDDFIRKLEKRYRLKICLVNKKRYKNLYFRIIRTGSETMINEMLKNFK